MLPLSITHWFTGKQGRRGNPFLLPQLEYLRCQLPPSCPHWRIWETQSRLQGHLQSSPVSPIRPYQASTHHHEAWVWQQLIIVLSVVICIYLFFTDLCSIHASKISCHLHVSLCTSVILWIGDLNYRISDLDVDNVKELINKRDFETLHNYDQVISPMVSPLYFLNSFCSSFCLWVGILSCCIWSSAQEADRWGSCVHWLCRGRDWFSAHLQIWHRLWQVGYKVTLFEGLMVHSRMEYL